MKVIIVGAGIGGLTTALALHAARIDVEVFEQARDLAELGVGINLLPHATRELAALGLLPALDQAGIRTRELIYANWSFGRTTLLGDAAHPMYPVGSNGASQAVLDARALATSLSSDVPVPEALAAYDAARRPATSQVVLSNRQGGPERVIDVVESRAPHGFENVDAVASHAEREAIVRGYATLAGCARAQDGS